MRVTRILVAGLTLVIVCVGLDGAVGSATIDTTGATVAAGTAATQGTVTIDPCAPAAVPPNAPALTPQGTLTATLPTKPDTGTGALGLVAITSDMTLPGGIYEYESLLIQDAVVTYTGPVTLCATGIIDIDGGIQTTGDNQPIVLVAGGSVGLEHRFGVPVTFIRTTGAASPITIDADRVDIGTGARSDGEFVPGAVLSRVTTVDGDITFRAHGPSADSNQTAVDIQSAEVIAGNGEVLLLSGTFVFLNWCRVVSEVVPVQGMTIRGLSA